MNVIHSQQHSQRTDDKVIKIAIMAVGGQGGGVLTSWIEALGRTKGYEVQATSVAGVSQRTGATIYYIEMLPASDKQPIFALAPSEGDVDILIAAEMMEVGRAIMRGFVTPDRTVLIGSSHRALAVSEKTIPGDGLANSQEVRDAAEQSAKRLILADMEKLAVQENSVISASLFGALAATGALPFDREDYEAAIRASGKGVANSLRAFSAGYQVVQEGERNANSDAVALKQDPLGPEQKRSDWRALVERTNDWPIEVQTMALAGLQKVVDYQSCAYGTFYLDRIETILKTDTAAHGWSYSVEAAKYIANAMTYDDIIRVADLKTRSSRYQRITNDVNVQSGQHLHITDYFHPRAEEMVSLLPARLGERWARSPRMMAILNKVFNRGRRLRTDGILSFMGLYFIGGLRNYRLRTLRHKQEVAHLEKWLARVAEIRTQNYALAVELLKNRRLIKGYSDTHKRGLNKFDSVMEAADLLIGRADAAEWMARLRTSALQDPDGKAMKGTLKTIKSFV
jgi:indolepyruvate ferredoxin oxidoreductase beta subunit